MPVMIIIWLETINYKAFEQDLYITGFFLASGLSQPTQCAKTLGYRIWQNKYAK